MIDIPTLIGCSVVLFAVMAVLFMLFWWREGRTRHLWFVMPFLMGCAGGAFLIDTSLLPGYWAERLGTAFILLTYGFGWQAVRTIYRRPFRPFLVLGPVVAWVALSALVFEPLDFPALSASVRALIIVLFSGLSARELRRRREKLPSSSVLVAVFLTYGGVAALRVPFTAFLPVPLGALPLEPWAVVVFNLLVVTQALLVAAFLISIMRERVALKNLNMAMLDPLTGIYNRRAFDHRVGAVDGESADGTVSLLLFDIDRFKAINDRFGHAVGDAVIVQAARAAEKVLRSGDTLYRVGGEEFVCLLPGMAAGDALKVAERLRGVFQATAAEIDGRAVAATISIGIASASGVASGEGVPPALFERADEALYRAKGGGRNQVVFADPLESAA